MRRLTVFGNITLGLLLAVACRKPSPWVDAGIVAQGPRALDGGAASAAPRLALTEAKLQAYVAYERNVLGVLSRAQAESKTLRDAGSEGRALLFRGLKSRAVERDAAQRASGLRDDEIEVLDALTQAVLAKRGFAKSFDYDAQIAQFEKVREKVPEAQRAQVDSTLGMLRKQQAALNGLSQERARFGSANVDLVLAQEGSLEKTYEATLELLGSDKIAKDR